METKEFGKHLTELIEDGYQEYQKVRPGLGWRLLASPLRTLDGADVAFLGVNPGGSKATENDGLSCEDGSAYTKESWADYPPGKDPLQRQVRLLFKHLNVDPDKVLSGNLVPFRSPNADDLPKSSIAFGSCLWRKILERSCPPLVVAMGRETTMSLAEILDAEEPPQEFCLNWGDRKARRWHFPEGTLIGLPCLSRYKVFGREKSKKGLREVFDIK